MSGASSADENQIQLLLSDLSEANRLIVLAPFAKNVTSSRKSGVLDALGVHLQILSLGCVVCPVDAVVSLIPFDSSLRAVALLALKLQVMSFTLDMLPRV